MCVEKTRGESNLKGIRESTLKRELDIKGSRLVQSMLCRVVGFLAVSGCMPDSSCAWTRRMITIATDPEGNKIKAGANSVIP